MEVQSPAESSSRPTASSGRVPVQLNCSSSGTSIESEDEGYQELYAELRSSRDKGKGVDHSFMPQGPRSEAERSPKAARTPQSKSSSRAWSDFDLSIVVALVSPIGNWLTGSDHIKNLFLIAFLIFYLHQLIEVPWKLYHASRPRNSARRALNRSQSGDGDASARMVRLASSELRTRELFFLALTVVSPVAGAYLVRYILATLEGVDNLSWFSTTLFVLATGIRPWSHFIERLNKRTQDLHDAIHYPSEESHAHQQGQVDLRLDRVLERLDTLDLAISELRSKVSTLEPLREVCDDLSEALGDVERNLLRHDRKIESVRVSHDTHLSTLEASLLQLEERHRRDRDILEDHAILLPHGRQVSGYIQTALLYLTRWSRKACKLIVPYLPFEIPTRPSSPHDLVQQSVEISSGTHSQNGSHHSPNNFTTRLETIPEDSDSDSDGTYVSGEDTATAAPSPPTQLKTTLKRNRSISPSKQREVGRMSVVGSLWSIAVWPYHVTIRLLFVCLLPVRKVIF